MPHVTKPACAPEQGARGVRERLLLEPAYNLLPCSQVRLPAWGTRAQDGGHSEVKGAGSAQGPSQCPLHSPLRPSSAPGPRARALRCWPQTAGEEGGEHRHPLPLTSQGPAGTTSCVPSTPTAPTPLHRPPLHDPQAGLMRIQPSREPSRTREAPSSTLRSGAARSGAPKVTREVSLSLPPYFPARVCSSTKAGTEVLYRQVPALSAALQPGVPRTGQA